MMDDLGKATSSNFFESNLMTDVLTGEIPSIGSHNTESKFQHHFNSQRPSSSSSITYQNSPFQNTLQSTARMGNLSVEAKAFKPIKGQQPPMQQQVGMQQIQFAGMPLDSDNQSMHMPLHVNPSAREFVPRMSSAPTLNQQPSLKPPLNGSYNSNIREYMPKTGRPNDIQPAPFYPPGTNFPSLPTNMGPRSDVSLTSSSNTRNHQQQQLSTNNMVEYMQDIPIPTMDPRHMPTSIYQSQSTNNSNYYSDGNSQSNPLNGGKQRKTNAKETDSPSRIIDSLVDMILNQHQASNNSSSSAPKFLPASMRYYGYSPAAPGTFNNRQQQQRPPLFSGDSSFISSNSPTISGGRSSPTTLGRRLGASAAVPVTHHSSAASMVSSNSHPELAEISGMNKQQNADSDRNKPVAHQNGGTTYFYPDSKMPGGGRMRGMVPHSVQFPGTPAHLEYLPKKSSASFFMGTDLRQEYNRRHELTMAQLNPEDELHAGIPMAVECYLHLYPLEPPQQANTLQKLALCYMSSCYKAFKEKDGKAYFMRRIHCFRQFNEKSMVFVDLWKKLHHANIVQLREVFTTKAFGELSMMFVHDFHAGSETLLTRHFRQNTYSKNKWNGARGAGVTHETLIWSYVVQLTAALRNIHANNLACRVMDLSKIIVTDKSRIRISGVGILDVLTYDSTNSPAQIQQYQQEDLIALGKIVLCLALNSLNVNINQQPVPKYVEMLNPNYSSDLKNLIMYLLVPQAQVRILSVNEIMPMIGARFYTQLDTTLLRCDIIENELEKEMENGRLYRLLSKLGVINERPEFGIDQRWSETGDRYLLKLFRDYVFHQVTETGEPFIDLAHVTSCLNKLDAGTGEKVCLMSRDEQNVLVVSYGELKRAITKCFSELLQSSISSSR